MKLVLSLLALLTLTACHTITIGNAKVTSFGQKTSISEMTYDPVTGLLTLKGYNNDQVSGMVALFEAGVAAGKKASGVP